jgi:hypothetical protein
MHTSPRRQTALDLTPRRVLRLKDGPGSARAATASVGLRWGLMLPPPAKTGPSRLRLAGEGRSDGGVLHLHPGAKPATREVADSERMNPQGGVARSRQCRGRRALGRVDRSTLIISTLCRRLGAYACCRRLEPTPVVGGWEPTPVPLLRNGFKGRGSGTQYNFPYGCE